MNTPSECHSHRLPREIVFFNQDSCMLICSQCFENLTSTATSNPVAVRFSEESIRFFISWNQAIIVELEEYKEAARKLGPRQLFRFMSLDNPAIPSQNILENPTVNEIVRLQLDNRITVLRRGLNFVSRSPSLDLSDVNFMKDLYRVVMEDVGKNLTPYCERIEEDLARAFSGKTGSNFLKVELDGAEVEVLNRLKKRLLLPVEQALIVRGNRQIRTSTELPSYPSTLLTPKRHSLSNSMMFSSVLHPSTPSSSSSRTKFWDQPRPSLSFLPATPTRHSHSRTTHLPLSNALNKSQTAAQNAIQTQPSLTTNTRPLHDRNDFLSIRIENQQLRTSNADLTQQICRLEDKLQEVSRNVHSLRELNEALTIEKSNLKTTQEDLMQQLIDAHNSLTSERHLREENMRLFNDLQQSVRLQRGQGLKIVHTKDMIRELEDTIAQFQNDLALIEEDIAVRISGLEAELEQSNEALMQAQQELAQYRSSSSSRNPTPTESPQLTQRVTDLECRNNILEKNTRVLLNRLQAQKSQTLLRDRPTEHSHSARELLNTPTLSLNSEKVEYWNWSISVLLNSGQHHEQSLASRMKERVSRLLEEEQHKYRSSQSTVHRSSESTTVHSSLKIEQAQRRLVTLSSKSQALVAKLHFDSGLFGDTPDNQQCISPQPPFGQDISSADCLNLASN